MIDDVVKIRTVKGQIITLSIRGVIDTHVRGVDKFGKFVVLPMVEIDSLLPVPEEIENDK